MSNMLEGLRPSRPSERSEERRVGKVTGVQTCALPIWKSAQHAQWEAWWAEKLQGHANRLQFDSITWARPKRSVIWDLFYQAIEIKTGLPKAVCQTCWKAYAHPDLRKDRKSVV